MSQLGSSHSIYASSPAHPSTPIPLFSSGPCVLLEQEVYELIETKEPTDADTLCSYVRHLCQEINSGNTKDHGFKIPNPETPVPSWLIQTRKRLHNVMVDTFFKIQKKRRAVNRLEEHREGLTFPPEYSSLKMPQLSKDPLKGEILNSFVNSKVLELKKTILDQHILTEHELLHGYSIICSKSVVAETFKSLAQTAYRNTFQVAFTDWSSLSYILADHSLIHKLCSQEVSKKLKQESEKRQKIQAAQALAAQQESTMSIKELVEHTIKLQIKSKTGQANNNNKKAPTKPASNTNPTSSGNTTTKPDSQPKKKGKNKKKKPADPNKKREQPKQTSNNPKKSSKKSNLKGQAPKGSSSTSFRPQTGGKN